MEFAPNPTKQPGYLKFKDEDSFPVDLPRRSMYIMTGDARYEWTHGIRNIQSRRVSFTFRSYNDSLLLPEIVEQRMLRRTEDITRESQLASHKREQEENERWAADIQQAIQQSQLEEAIKRSLQDCETPSKSNWKRVNCDQHNILSDCDDSHSVSQMSSKKTRREVIDLEC